jgi:hypothetical protein
MERARKYAKKINAGVIGARYDAQKEMMVRGERNYFASAQEIEIKIKKLVDGISSLNQIYYIIFAKEIQKIIKTHTAGNTVMEEMEILQKKWETRGLDENIMNKIKVMLVPSYVPPSYFIMDISLLDGPDILA